MSKRFDLRAVDGLVANAIVPRVGGACTFSRVAAATQTNSGGGTSSIGANIPRVSYWLDPVSGLWTPGYQLESVDNCAFAYTQGPETITWFVDFYEEVASATATGRIFCIGATLGGGGASYTMECLTAKYYLTWWNNASSVNANTGTLSWAIGDRVRLRFVHDTTNNTIQMWGRVNGAAEATAGATAAPAVGATWNHLVLTLNADYLNVSPGARGFRSLQAATGILTAFPSDVGKWHNTLGTRRGSRQAA